MKEEGNIIKKSERELEKIIRNVMKQEQKIKKIQEKMFKFQQQCVAEAD